MSDKLRTFLFYITLFLFIAIMTFQSNIVDFDLFARLLQGQAFWELGNILQRDIFSYTPVNIWYDHEWGASVVFYWVLNHFGDLGLLLLQVFMVFGIFYFAIETLKLRGVNNSTPYNFLFYFFAYHAAGNSAFGSVIRCHLFTFLFFSIWLYLLERIRIKKEYHWLVTFVPMMLFWSNIHGGCVAGLGLLILYAIGEALNRKTFKYYLTTLAVCFLILFVNPWGVGYVKFLLHATTMPRPVIAEWNSPFALSNLLSHLRFNLYFVFFTLISLLTLFIKRNKIKNIDYTKTLVLIVMAYLSASHIKHQWFFVVAVIVFLYNDFYWILNNIFEKLRINLTSKFICIKECFLFILILLGLVGYLSLNKPHISTSFSKYPIKAIEFIKINKLNGNLLVNFHHGSYTAYKLYPHNLIAMDGRYEEVYPDYLLAMMNNFYMQATDRPNMLIEMFRPDIIVMENYFKAKDYLLTDKSYTKVFEDEFYTLFVDKKLVKKSYIKPSDDIKYYNKHLFDIDLKFKKFKPNKA